MQRGSGCEVCRGNFCRKDTDLTHKSFSHTFNKNKQWVFVEFEFKRPVDPEFIIKTDTGQIYRPYIPQYCTTHWNIIKKKLKLAPDDVVPYGGLHYLREDLFDLVASFEREDIDGQVDSGDASKAHGSDEVPSPGDSESA
jgi:hypothetical protein